MKTINHIKSGRYSIQVFTKARSGPLTILNNLGSCKIHITDNKVQINSLTVKKCLQTSYGSHPHHMKIICDSTCHSSWIADSHKLQPGATFSITIFLQIEKKERERKWARLMVFHMHQSNPDPLFCFRSKKKTVWWAEMGPSHMVIFLQSVTSCVPPMQSYEQLLQLHRRVTSPFVQFQGNLRFFTASDPINRTGLKQMIELETWERKLASPSF